MKRRRGHPTYQCKRGTTPPYTLDAEKDLRVQVTRVPVKVKSVPIAAVGLSPQERVSLYVYKSEEFVGLCAQDNIIT